MKKPSIRKIVRMLSREQPSTDPRISFYCYQMMNKAVDELHRKIISDIRELSR